MVTWLPYYLMRERGFSMGGMAKVGGAFFLLAAISASVCGLLSDQWIASGATPNRVRKTFMITALLGIGIALAANVASSGSLSIVWLIAAAAFFGLGSSNMWAITQTLAGPRAVGTWCGVQLFCGNLAGVVVPAVTGVILQRTGRFAWAFLIVAAISWIGALAWIFLVGRIEPVLWRRLTEPGFPPLVEQVKI
jgi:MFS transporter, ACS family, D-galactonate transporter